MFVGKVVRAVEERRLFEKSLGRVAPSLLRSIRYPRAGELLELSTEWAQVLDLLASDWRTYLSEYAEVEASLAARYRTRRLVFPLRYSAESITSKMLYLMVRSRKPRTVVETGVANGHTTVVLMAAIMRNEFGTLHSTDVADGVGCLLNEREYAKWQYHPLPLRGARSHFRKLMRELAPLDLFFHDSDHHCRWQYFEYEQADAALGAGGVLASDDVDASYAFLDYCRRRRIRPLVVADRRQMTGFVLPRRAPTEAPAPSDGCRGAVARHRQDL